MQNHVKILGILYIVFGALGTLAAIGLFLSFGAIASMIGLSAATGDPDAAVAAPILGGIGALVAFFMLLASLPGIIVGWGLMNFKSWSRILGMIVSVLQLFAVPIGTAIGFYGLWVLLNSETETLFRNPPPPGTSQVL